MLGPTVAREASALLGQLGLEKLLDRAAQHEAAVLGRRYGMDVSTLARSTPYSEQA